MFVYRKMSVEEFEKFNDGEVIEGKIQNQPPEITDCAGKEVVCFMPTSNETLGGVQNEAESVLDDFLKGSTTTSSTVVAIFEANADFEHGTGRYSASSVFSVTDKDDAPRVAELYIGEYGKDSGFELVSYTAINHFELKNDYDWIRVSESGVSQNEINALKENHLDNPIDSRTNISNRDFSELSEILGIEPAGYGELAEKVNLADKAMGNESRYEFSSRRDVSEYATAINNIDLMAEKYDFEIKDMTASGLSEITNRLGIELGSNVENLGNIIDDDVAARAFDREQAIKDAPATQTLSRGEVDDLADKLGIDPSEVKVLEARISYLEASGISPTEGNVERALPILEETGFVSWQNFPEGFDAEKVKSDLLNGIGHTLSEEKIASIAEKLGVEPAGMEDLEKILGFAEKMGLDVSDVDVVEKLYGVIEENGIDMSDDIGGAYDYVNYFYHRDDKDEATVTNEAGFMDLEASDNDIDELTEDDLALANYYAEIYAENPSSVSLEKSDDNLPSIDSGEKTDTQPEADIEVDENLITDHSQIEASPQEDIKDSEVTQVDADSGSNTHITLIDESPIYNQIESGKDSSEPQSVSSPGNAAVNENEITDDSLYDRTVSACENALTDPYFSFTEDFLGKLDNADYDKLTTGDILVEALTDVYANSPIAEPTNGCTYAELACDIVTTHNNPPLVCIENICGALSDKGVDSAAIGIFENAMTDDVVIALEGSIPTGDIDTDNMLFSLGGEVFLVGADNIENLTGGGEDNIKLLEKADIGTEAFENFMAEFLGDDMMQAIESTVGDFADDMEFELDDFSFDLVSV